MMSGKRARANRVTCNDLTSTALYSQATCNPVSSLTEAESLAKACAKWNADITAQTHTCILTRGALRHGIYLHFFFTVCLVSVVKSLIHPKSLTFSHLRTGREKKEKKKFSHNPDSFVEKSIFFSTSFLSFVPFQNAST